MTLLMAALNDLEVKVGDVLNAYITAPITKKVWTVLGPKLGSDTGKTAIIVCALGQPLRKRETTSDRAYPKIPRCRRGKRHHHGGDVCGLVVFPHYSYRRNPTG